VAANSDKPSSRSLDDLDARLKRLRADTRPPERQGAVGEPTTGLGMAFTVASHLVVGLAVGAGIGYMLDQWMGTSPFMLIVFFFLGAAAGGMNMYRTVKGYGMSVGFQPAELSDAEAEDKRTPSRVSKYKNGS